MKFSPERIRKIAVFRALQLGDMLCTVPALKALRRAYPSAHITLLGLPWAASFVSRFSHYLDDFIHFPGYVGLPEQSFDASRWSDFVNRMKEENFDLILQMQGDGSVVNEMLTTFFSGQIAGFHRDGCWRDERFFLQYPSHLHEIERHLALMQHLGIPSYGVELEFPIYTTEQQALAALSFPLVPYQYICIHPGSRGVWRQWAPAYFAALADECAQLGFRCILTGTEEEKGITQQVAYLMRTRPIDLSGKTGLGEVAFLIQNAFLLISNCTGVSHIASATRTPSVVISMDGEPHRWGPFDTQLHRTINWLVEPDFEKVKIILYDLISKVGYLKKRQPVST